MKKLSLVLITLIVITCYYSCERDDICPESTPTTPSVIIDVFDFENQENKKSIQNLTIGKINTDNVFEVLPTYYFVAKNNLVLPLRTDANTTQYTLIKDSKIDDNGTEDDTSDDTIVGNYDVLTINYTRKDVFVSRACGYKTIFENVTLTIENDVDTWILSQQSLNLNQSVEDETTTHFNIFH